MQSRSRFTLLALAVAACHGGSAAPLPDGPLRAGVVSGNHQIVPAAPVAQLPQQVGVQVVRTPSGAVALRVLDALLPPRAYAQTAVVGVPNQVVCARTPDPKHALTPEVLCANSNAAGVAFFVFHADTVAGVSRAQVALSTPTGTLVTDSVEASVLAGVPSRLHLTQGNGDGSIYPATGRQYLGQLPAGATIDLRIRIDTVVDKYNNLIPSNSWPVEYGFSADPNPTVLPALLGRGLTATVPDGAKSFVVRIGTAVQVFYLRWGVFCGSPGMLYCDPQ